MNLNTQKLNKIFHEMLSIISDLQLIDQGCKNRKCKYSRDKVHAALLKCQKQTLKVRQDLLEAIEEE